MLTNSSRQATSADLRGAVSFFSDLTYAHLSAANFKEAWLHSVDLTHADLHGARLGGGLFTSTLLMQTPVFVFGVRRFGVRGTRAWSGR
jgi:uncharacterized protein YjbI with pentapeptide repeats